MDTLGGYLAKYREALARIEGDSCHASARAMPGDAFVIDDTEVLCLPRAKGDSRYPLGRNGMNFWVYGSGYMHGNEGLFSTFLRAAEGQEPNIAFFAGLPGEESNDPWRVISVLPVPDLGTGDSAAAYRRCAILGPSAAHFLCDGPELNLGLRVFVDDSGAISFSLLAENALDEETEFYLSSYFNPYLRNQIYESGEDRWFKEIRLVEADSGKQLPSFVAKVNEDKDREHSISHYGILRRHLGLAAPDQLVSREETTSRYQYVGGSRASLHHAASLAAGTFGNPQHVCAFTETAICADLMKFRLRPGGSIRLEYVFETTDNALHARRRAGIAPDPDERDHEVELLREDDKQRHASLHAKFTKPDGEHFSIPVMNAFFEHLKRQVEFCSLIKGYVQLSKNSLIGIRDVFQALEGLLFWQPDAAREKMLEALGYTAPDGRCFRQYSLPSTTGVIGRMDLRPFIDQGCWVISCVATYLRVTGDLDFLNTSCGYHEIVDEKTGVVCPTEFEDTVLEHLLKIMDYLLAHRDKETTGCIRALYGDWNDALDGLGVSTDPDREYGNGVSVMATLQVFGNTTEMIEILEAVDGSRLSDEIERYRKAHEALAQALREHAVLKQEGDQRIAHGWGDRRSYYVGSFEDPDGRARDGLTSNAFWVLSGMRELDTSLDDCLLRAFERLDGKYGFKTFEPFFPENTPGVGRIGKLPAGTAENGAAYIHATAFAIMALFQMGRSKEAWEQLYKILPFTALHERLSHSPFVMPNSYGYNEAVNIDGENMNDWQTGSSNVMLKTMIRCVFGFEPRLDGFWIQPAAWCPFPAFECTLPWHGRMITIRYKQDDSSGPRRFIVDGESRRGTVDPASGLERLWLSLEEIPEGSVSIDVHG